MKTTLIIIILITITSLPCIGQRGNILWEKRMYDTNTDGTIQRTSINNFYITKKNELFVAEDRIALGMNLYKMDFNGNINWKSNISLPDNQTLYASPNYIYERQNDPNRIHIGSQLSELGDKIPFLIGTINQISYNRNTGKIESGLKDRKDMFSPGNFTTHTFSKQDEFVMCTRRNIFPKDDTTTHKLFFYKADTNGKLIYTGKFYDGLPNELKYIPIKITQLKDDGFVIIANSVHDDLRLFRIGLVVRLDKDMKIMWSKQITPFTRSIYSIEELSSGSFLVVGSRFGEIVQNRLMLVITKLDKDGYQIEPVRYLSYLSDAVIGAKTQLLPNDGLVVVGKAADVDSLGYYNPYSERMILFETDSTGFVQNFFKWKIDTLPQSLQAVIRVGEGDYIVGGRYDTDPDAVFYSYMARINTSTKGVTNAEKESQIKFTITNENASITYSNLKGKTEIELWNNLGQKIKTILSMNENFGPHIKNFRVGELSNGVYYLHIKLGDKIEVKKFIIQR
ncbi:MAG: T9SS type A sorting domain-containing protein [Chlorobi bacterium]|nr:T9SS type A sorting domain-containing protein [Chlorobiota bacterium]